MSCSMRKQTFGVSAHYSLQILGKADRFGETIAQNYTPPPEHHPGPEPESFCTVT